MALQSFVALDFETMTAERTSACAVGLVKVKDCVITQMFYTLINPIPDERTTNNSHVHGITSQMVEGAPTFEQIFPLLVDFIGSYVIVCHNAAFDIDVMNKCMKYYGLQGINTAFNLCTYEATGLSLEKACSKYNIYLNNHHNALDDATACAKIFLAWSGEKCIEASPSEPFFKKPSEAMSVARKYERSTLDKLDDEDIDDKSTPFYNAKVVITGTFDLFPNRNKIGKALQSLGADVNTAISKKTNIVVVGDGAGPSKLAKIDELQNDGYDIRIMEEEELEDYIGDIYDNI